MALPRSIYASAKFVPDLNEDQLNELTNPGFFRNLLGAITAPVSTALDILDVPGSYLRGALAGRFGERLSGRELLAAYGGEKNPDGFDWAGLGVDILVDPLMFAGSITGLTKVGKAAKLTEETISRIKNLERLTEVEQSLSARKFFKGEIKSLKDSLSKRLGRTVDELKPEDVLGKSRLDQVKLGQRGLSFSLPGGKSEIVLNAPNVFIEQLLSKVPAGVMDNKLTKGMKKYFSTAKASLFGKYTKELTDVMDSQAIANAEVQIINAEKMLDDYVKTTKGMTKEKALEDIAFAQEAIPAPEKARVQLQKLEDNYKVQVERINKRHNDQLAEFKKQAQANPNQLGVIQEEIDDLEKLKDFKLNMLEGKYNKKVTQIAEFKNQLMFALEQVAPNGSIPRQLAETFKQASEDSLEFMKGLGVAVTELDDVLGYLPHILSEEGRRLFFRDEKFRKKFGRIIIEGVPDFQKKRKMRMKTVAEINTKIKAEHGVENAFVNNPLQLYKAREIATQYAVTKARTVQAAIHFHATELPNLKGIAKTTGIDLHDPALREAYVESRKGFVPIEQVLLHSGMNRAVIGDKIVEWPIGTAIKKGPKAAKVIRNKLAEQGITNFYLPVEVAEDITKTHQTFINPSAFWRGFDFINDMTKTYLTSFNPAHIGTNELGNIFMNYVRWGIADTVKYTKEAMELMAQNGKEILAADPAKLTDGQKALRRFIELGQGGQAFYDDTRGRIRFVNKKLDRFAKAILDNKGIEQAYRVNDFMEKSSKFAHFLAARKSGMDDFAAMASTKKYLFDYGDLTDFEKQVMRRGVLFYTFSRKNLPLSIMETFTNRRAYLLGKTSTSTLGSEEFIPAYVKDTGSIAIGNDQFVDVRNPLFESNRLSTQGGGIERLAQKLFGQTVLPLKIPYELATGKETFRGKPFKQLSRVPDYWEGFPGTNTFTRRDGGKETVADPRILQILRSMPTARITQTFEDITNPEVSLFSMLGPRIRTLPAEQRKAKLTQDLLLRAADQNIELRELHRYFSVSDEPSNFSKSLIDQIEKNRKALMKGR